MTHPDVGLAQDEQQIEDQLREEEDSGVMLQRVR
jgi:hypothetical protein